MNNYMTVETTFLEGCACFSMQSNVDVQNGSIVGKGSLVTGEDSIYMALDDYSDGLYLVANPAWSYDTSRKVNQNEENFINKAGIPFRVYELKLKDRQFKIGNLPAGTALAKDDYVEFKNGAWAKATGNTALKVVEVEDLGFPYFIGSYGSAITGDTTNEYGSGTIDTRNKKYTIEVVA